MKSRAKLVRRARRAGPGASLVAGCGEQRRRRRRDRRRPSAAAAGAGQGLPDRPLGRPGRAGRAAARPTPTSTTTWPSRSTSTTTACSPSTATKSSRSSTDSKDVFVVANPAYEQMEGIVAGVPRLAHYDVDIDAGSDASTPEDAVSFTLDDPRRQEAETAGQPLLPDRDRALRDQPRPAGEGRQGRRRRRRQGRVRRGPARRRHLQGDARRIRRAGEEPRRRRAGVRTDPLRRADLDRDHDPDDERVLRSLEELALHRR